VLALVVGFFLRSVPWLRRVRPAWGGPVSQQRSTGIPDARSIVEQVLGVLKAAGIRATGGVGAADPAVAVADGLATYAADVVVVARHPARDMRHLEGVPVERAAARAGVPLREIDLSRSGSVRVAA